MRFEELVVWIKAQERRGLTPNQIAQALLIQGYPRQEVEDAFAAARPKNHKGLLLPITIFSVALIIIVATVWFYYPTKIEILGVIPLVATPNCGADQACFEASFAKCSPAVFTPTINFFGEITYEYLVVGPKDNRCEIRQRYLVNPNPDWVGHSMTCTYDNTLGFDASVEAVTQSMLDENVGGCYGPLFEIIRNPVVET